MTKAPGNASSGNSPRPEIREEVIFDGSPSWVGRFGAFALTWLLALGLVVGAVVAMMFANVPWWIVAIGVVLAIVVVVAQAAYHRTLRYRVTNYRIDFERGLTTRRIDSLELWHADDLVFRQTLIERMMGLGTIDILSDDKTSQKLCLVSVPEARPLFDRLKTCILNAKRQRGLLELDQ